MSQTQPQPQPTKTLDAETHYPLTSYKKSCIIAVLLTVSVLTLIALNGNAPWFDDPSSAQRRIEWIESANFEKNSVKPKVVIWGSSRPSFGIQSRQLSKELGYQPEEGLNLAFPGFSDQVFINVLERNYDTITQARLWLIGIDDYFLLASAAASPALSPGQRLEEWVQGCLGGLVWINQRGQWLLKHLYASMGMYRLSWLPWKLTEAGNWEDPSVSSRIVDPVADKAVFKTIVDSYFSNKKMDPKLIQPYERLLQVAQQHKIRVVLVSPPFHPYYSQLAYETYADIIRENRAGFQTLADKYHVPFIFCEDAQGCGVSEKEFADAVHLNRRGSQLFTHFLSGQVKNLLNKQ